MSPKSRPAASATPTVTASTDPSNPIWSSRGRFAPRARSRRLRLVASTRRSATPPNAIAVPMMPPRSDSSALSVRNCRIRRPRDAPTARRTAISRSRVAIRASSRLATLTQAISSTSPTDATSITTPASRAARSRHARVTTRGVPDSGRRLPCCDAFGNRQRDTRSQPAITATFNRLRLSGDGGTYGTQNCA